CSERDGHFAFVRIKHGTDGCDGAATADRRATGNKMRCFSFDPQPLAHKISKGESPENCCNRKKYSGFSCFENIPEVHSEAKPDDGNLQKNFCGFVIIFLIRMTYCQRDKKS